MPTTALVLSAGGMFGAYQAGVWRALESRLKPDMVIGASVGALNGYAIAGGCTGQRLTEAWLDPSAGDTLRRLPNQQWTRDPAGMAEQTTRLTTEFTPRIPFALTAVELPFYRTRVFWSPAITAQHLAASCTVPGLLPPLQIGPSRYIDGGIFDKMPISIAVRAGATRIIAIDALPPVGPWWLRSGMSLMRLIAHNRRTFPGIDVTIISPSEPLGEVRDAIDWTHANAARWIALGERDALRVCASVHA